MHSLLASSLLISLPLAAALNPPQPATTRLGIIYQHPISHRQDANGQIFWDQPVPYSQIPNQFSQLVFARNQMRQFLPAYRQQGYQGQALVYLNIAGIAGPSPDFNQPGQTCRDEDWRFKGYQNQPAMDQGDFCEIITAIQHKRALPDYPDLYPDESWFLHGHEWRLTPKRIVSVRPIDSSAPHSSGYEYRMNPANKGWQTYVARRALRELQGGLKVHWDGSSEPHPSAINAYPAAQSGIFLDNLERRLTKFNQGLFAPNGYPLEYRDSSNQPQHQNYAQAIAQLSRQVRAALQQSTEPYPLWGNLGDIQPGNNPSDLGSSDWDLYQTEALLDGAMLETFALKWGAQGAWDIATLRRQLTTLHRWQRSASHPKQLLLAAPTGFAKSSFSQEARFAYALYWLIAEGNQTTFNLHEAQGGQKYARFIACPDYLQTFGEPLGSYFELASEPGILKRHFELGTLEVNLNTLQVSLPVASNLCSFP